MRFTISPQSGLIQVGNLIVPAAITTLPPNVLNVTWDGDKGEIWYNDRASLTTEFTDPTPYQPYIDTWMATAAAGVSEQSVEGGSSIALSLAQAQQVKSSLIESVFKAQRQLPIAYPVAAGPYSWDCSDEGVTQMHLALGAAIASGPTSLLSSISSGTGGLVGGINTAFATLVAQIDTLIGAGEVNPSINFNINQAATAGTFADLLPIPGGISVSGAGVNTGPSSAPIVQRKNVFIPPAATLFLTASSGAITLPTIQWTPIGLTAPVILEGAEFSGLVSAVVARRAKLQANRLALQAAIAAATTAAAVAAIDITTGWNVALTIPVAKLIIQVGDVDLVVPLRSLVLTAISPVVKATTF
jgi:hypothetical protein